MFMYNNLNTIFICVKMQYELFWQIPDNHLNYPIHYLPASNIKLSSLYIDCFSQTISYRKYQNFYIKSPCLQEELAKLFHHDFTLSTLLLFLSVVWSKTFVELYLVQEGSRISFVIHYYFSCNDANVCEKYECREWFWIHFTWLNNPWIAFSRINMIKMKTK